MKIELKKIKYFEAGSEETFCFNADIWIDGRYQGSVRNDGRGGSHIISPPSLEAQLSEWGKQLPPYDLGIPFREDPTKPMMVDHDAESLINDIMTDWLYAKDLKKLLRNKILFTRHGEHGVFNVKPNVKPEVALQSPAVIVKMRDAHQSDKILNLLPFEEALSIYIEQGK